MHESGGGALVHDRAREGILIALLADWLMIERDDRAAGMSGPRHCWNGADKSDYSNKRNNHVLGRDGCVAGCAVWERPEPHDSPGAAPRDEPEEHEMDEEMGHSDRRGGKNCGWNEQGQGHAGRDRNTLKMQGVLGSGQDGGREDAVGDDRDEPRGMGGCGGVAGTVRKSGEGSSGCRCFRRCRCWDDPWKEGNDDNGMKDACWFTFSAIESKL